MTLLVGLIALAGVAAETASIMIVYLDNAYRDAQQSGRMKTTENLYDAGRGTMADVLQAKAWWLEAQAQILREHGK